MSRPLQTYEEAMKRLERDAPPPADAGLFGCDLAPEEAKLILIPVPWDATTSYRQGTAKGPGALLSASHQVDLEDGSFGSIYRAGIAMLPEQTEIAALNVKARALVDRVTEALGDGEADPKDLAWVNEASCKVNGFVKQSAETFLRQGKLVGVVGGDHAAPFGLIEALGVKHPEGFGILHFDAHHDLRDAYEGFTFSHASIHFNTMERCAAVSKLVQVGIRDFSAAEKDYMRSLGRRGAVFYQREMVRLRSEGMTLGQLVDKILSELPAQIYISFDIDALDPSYCPSTGTPVPGGLLFDEAVYFLERLAASGKKIIGFDLCEVAPSEDPDNEWDANVGVRLLYKLCGAMLRTQRLC